MSDIRTQSPSSGTHLERPGSGRLIVLSTSEQTAGRLTEVEAVCEPGPPGVGERSFDRHDVSFELLEGRLTVGVEGSERVLRAGQTLELPAGTSHRIWVADDAGPARFLWRLRPATDDPDLLGLLFG